MKPINVGLLGIGTVGGGTFTVLKRNQEEIIRRAGRGIVIKMIADLETEQASISARLADPDLYQKAPEEMQKLNQRFTEIDALLIESLEKWETIEARAKG